MRALDQNQAITQQYAFEDFLSMFVCSHDRFISILFAVFSAVALGLAAIGLFSVVAYSVEQRTREIGIRIALNVVRTTFPSQAESNSSGVLMKTIRAAFALPILAMALAGMPALAQDHQDQDHRDNHTYKQHQEWKTGSKVQQEDWNRGDKVDYRQNHLRRPPAGHEWRQIDGNYVLANRDGTIVSVRQAPHDH